jgi:aspartate/glutamate racemase
LAIGVTLNKRLYQDPLEKLGIEWESIQEELAVDLDKAIFGVMEGKDPQEISSPAIKAIDYLRGKNVESIILGCTELPILLGKQVNSPDLINPSKLLAEAAVRFAISQ